MAFLRRLFRTPCLPGTTLFKVDFDGIRICLLDDCGEELVNSQRVIRHPPAAHRAHPRWLALVQRQKEHGVEALQTGMLPGVREMSVGRSTGTAAATFAAAGTASATITVSGVE